MEERKNDFTISDNHYGGGAGGFQPKFESNTNAGPSARPMASMSSE